LSTTPPDSQKNDFREPLWPPSIAKKSSKYSNTTQSWKLASWQLSFAPRKCECT
jgi:hypothetical protein